MKPESYPNSNIGTMEYKGYIGSIELSDSDGIFFGKIQDNRALISYEGVDLNKLERNFRSAVDEYISLERKDRERIARSLFGSVSDTISYENARNERLDKI